MNDILFMLLGIVSCYILTCILIKISRWIFNSINSSNVFIYRLTKSKNLKELLELDGFITVLPGINLIYAIFCLWLAIIEFIISTKIVKKIDNFLNKERNWLK